MASISMEQAEQARDLRGVIEELAARAAAERRAADYVDQLEAVVDDMRRAVQRDDPVRFRECDMAFHRLVCHASGNHLLPRIWEVMEPSLWTLRVVSDPFYTGSRDTLIAEHDRLLQLLVTGQADDAAQAFRLHAIGAAGLSHRDEQQPV